MVSSASRSAFPDQIVVRGVVGVLLRLRFDDRFLARIERQLRLVSRSGEGLVYLALRVGESLFEVLLQGKESPHVRGVTSGVPRFRHGTLSL